MTDTLESLLKAEPYSIPDPRPMDEHGRRKGNIPEDLKCPDCDGRLDSSHFYQFKEIGCFSCYFWLEKLRLDHGTWKNDFAIIEGTHYYIASENVGSNFRGCGGAKSTIKFKDGRIRVTTNLWVQGSIPPRFRPFMPDNAEFGEMTWPLDPKAPRVSEGAPKPILPVPGIDSERDIEAFHAGYATGQQHERERQEEPSSKKSADILTESSDVKIGQEEPRTSPAESCNRTEAECRVSCSCVSSREDSIGSATERGENRLSGWATDLLSKRLREIAWQGNSFDVNQALRAAADRLDALSSAQPPKSFAETLSYGARDWREDIVHENGGYINTCIECKGRFVGHKRRVVCKLCAAETEAPSSASAPKLHWYCWIHDTPEECAKGKCGFGYWLCPECKTGMKPDDAALGAYEGIWRCPECETFVDFASMKNTATASVAPETTTMLGVVCGACGGRVYMLTCNHVNGSGHDWTLVSVCVSCRLVSWIEEGCHDCSKEGR